MSHASTTLAAAPRHRSLRREIIAILTFKLIALIVLRFLFFNERPEITPGRIEQRILHPSDAPRLPGPPHERTTGASVEDPT